MAIIDMDAFNQERAERQRLEMKERWGLLTIEELSAPLPPIPWLCEGVGLAPGAVSLFAGYGYSRKTMALQSAAVSVMAGRPLWGLWSVRQGRALHLDYEQGRRIDQERYQRLCRGAGFDLRDLPKDALTLGCMPKVYLDAKGFSDELLRLCEDKALVIVDSFKASFPTADENSSDVRAHLDVLNRVSERTGACICVIHHARKPNKDNADGATFAIRGSSALFDACQSVYVFEGAKDTPTTVHHQKDRIRGVTAEEFCLTSEDIPGPTGPRCGLRVAHLDAGQVASVDMARKQLKSDAAAAQVAARIVDALKEGFPGSRTDVRALVKAGTKAFDAAWAKLMADGRLKRGGTHKNPVWAIH